MILEKPNFFVFTGGPGVGKTSLIRRLQATGELVVEETARAVIREQVDAGGRGVPWIDARLFGDLCVARDIAIFESMAGETRRVFFDRGILDSHGGNGVPPSPAIIEAVRRYRYNPTVFVFPPWPEIYETDAERRQGWVEAEATFGQIMSRLPALGYTPLVGPTGDLGPRAAFVLARAV